MIAYAARIADRVDKAASATLCKIADKGVRIADDHLKMQDLGWEPLSEITIDRKIRRGRSAEDAHKVLVDTSQLQNALQKWGRLKGRQKELRVGIPAEIPYFRPDLSNRSTFQVHSLLEAHELGTRAVVGGSRPLPIRPLLGPTLSELQEWGRAKFAGCIADELQKTRTDAGEAVKDIEPNTGTRYHGDRSAIDYDETPF